MDDQENILINEGYSCFGKMRTLSFTLHFESQNHRPVIKGTDMVDIATFIVVSVIKCVE